MRLVLGGPPEAVRFDASSAVAAMYLLSPFVWREHNAWRIAVRAVPRSEKKQDKISRVHLGSSDDGVRFQLDDIASLSPGPGADDRDGCEDPTVVRDSIGYRTFYSGWNESCKEGTLLSATADSATTPVRKLGRVLPQPSRFVNAKEASVACIADGTWRLLFEYSADSRSVIGMAASDTLGGPWTPLADPLVRRPGMWDDVHMSPGPIIVTGDAPPLLFYNGANGQTQWRIGWAQLDANCTTVEARSTEPLITPPKPVGDASDIAFCSSAVPDGEHLWLYYTVSDKDCFRVPVHIST